MRTFIFSDQFKSNTIYLICLVCLFLFLYTGYSKIQDHERFLTGLLQIAVIKPIAVYVSWAVPIIEVVTAFLLLIPISRFWGLYSFTFFMSVFTIYIISMKLWASRLPCRCGGAIERLSWTQHIWFNLVFIALAVFAIWLKKTNKFNNQRIKN